MILASTLRREHVDGVFCQSQGNDDCFARCFCWAFLSMLLVGCADKKSEAGDLMAEGSYQEALEIYGEP